MRNYKLKISDYRYPKEKPVLFGTMAVSAFFILIIFAVNIGLGIGLLISIGFLLLNLYSMQMKMLGLCVRVSDKQFPRVHKLAQLAADRLDMDMPPVYIMQNPVMNAFATGFWGNYFIVLHSSLLEAFTDEELMVTIGHEFSHIKGNHVLLNAIMNMGVGTGMRMVPVLSWLQFIIQFVLLYVGRCFEYTCDRGGLIAAGDVKAFITSKTKYSVGKELFKSINIMEFYKQALELDKKPLGFMAELESTHPLTINRIRQAVRFYRSNTYRRISEMQGKAGTATLQGSLATGDLMDRIINKPKGSKVQNPQNTNSGQHNQITSAQIVTSTGQKPKQFCKKCGTQRRGDAAFCIACGTKYEEVNVNTAPVYIQDEDIIPVIVVEEAAAIEKPAEKTSKICSNCGKHSPVHAVFCNECGNRF